MKKLLTSMAAMTLCGMAFGQSVLNDPSCANAVVLRDPARQSSTEVDAIVYNPAGTALLSKGWHFSLSGVATLHETNATRGNNNYTIKNNYFLPSFQFAFKHGKWAHSASFAKEGGFFVKNYPDGSPILDDVCSLVNSSQPVADLDYCVKLFGEVWELGHKTGDLPLTPFHSDDELRLAYGDYRPRLVNWGFRLGTAYSITKHISAYIGVKVNTVSWQSKANIGFEVYNPTTGTSIPFDQYTQNARMGMIGITDPAIENIFADVVAGMDNINSAMKASTLQFEQSRHGCGIAPIVGFDYNVSTLNFGIKYEFANHIFMNKGEDTSLHSILSVGGSWKTFNWLKLAVGSDVYFKPSCSSLYRYDNSTFWNLSASATVKPCDQLSVSFGYRCTKENHVSNETMAVEGSYVPFTGIHEYNILVPCISFGLAYDVSSHLQLNMGAIWAYKQINQHLTANYNLNGTSMISSELVSHSHPRTQIGVGLNFRY